MHGPGPPGEGPGRHLPEPRAGVDGGPALADLEVDAGDLLLGRVGHPTHRLAERDPRPPGRSPGHQVPVEGEDPVPVIEDDEVRVAMKMAHDAGVQNVLLTRGSRGDAYFSNGEDIWYAKREFNIKLVSSVCAGDCTLAAFLHKWYRDRDNVEEAMKLAMATGANVAESVGIGDFGHVDEYSKRVAVRKLDRQ